MLRKAILLLLISTLGGCGLAARKEREEAAAAAKAQSEAGLADCEARYPPTGGKNAIEKTQCINAALAVLRPFVPYPDLLDQDMANRALLAERVQTGKMTPAEATQEMAQRRSQVTAEEQRRNLSSRSVNAQESAAAAAWRASAPVSCTRVGNTTNCF